MIFILLLEMVCYLCFEVVALPLKAQVYCSGVLLVLRLLRDDQVAAYIIPFTSFTDMPTMSV